jgi:hypothetical protein
MDDSSTPGQPEIELVAPVEIETNDGAAALSPTTPTTTTTLVPSSSSSSAPSSPTDDNPRGKEKYQISFLVYLWTFFLVFTSWFSIVSVPFPIVLVSYNLSNPHHTWFTILCYSADIVFLVDIVLSFIYPALRFDGKVWTKVDQRSGIKGGMQYLCSPSAFLIDFVSMIPLELIGLALSGQHVWLLRSNRLLRLLRFSHLWRVVNKYWWEHHYYGSIHQRRMWALFFTMAVASHFAGLFFYLVSYFFFPFFFFPSFFLWFSFV